MAIRLSSSKRGGLRLNISERLGPFRIWRSEPIGKKTTRTGRKRKANSGWSVKL
jgi:hypothetical protein